MHYVGILSLSLYLIQEGKTEFLRDRAKVRALLHIPDEEVAEVEEEEEQLWSVDEFLRNMAALREQQEEPTESEWT